MHNFIFVVTSVEHHLTVKVLVLLCFTQERGTEGKFTSFHLLTSGKAMMGWLQTVEREWLNDLPFHLVLFCVPLLFSSIRTKVTTWFLL